MQSPEFQPPERKILVIMFTDIVGYSGLMNSDESTAIKVLTENRAIHNQLAKEYQGRIIKEIGDGQLLVFETVSNAVNCAIDIQKRVYPMADLTLRIGIHMGEVVMQNDDIIGDGVNIASRVESIASPNEILVSDSIAQNLLNKTSYQISYLGEKQLKNVSQPVKVYSIKAANSAKLKNKERESSTASLPQDTVFEEMKRENSRKSRNIKLFYILTAIVALVFIILYFSIYKKSQEASSQEKILAIMPFKSLSSDPENTYLASGMTEDVQIQVSKMNDLTVISRLAMDSYDLEGKDLADIVDDLGASHILQGSFSKVDDNLRVRCQLVDTQTGKEIWSQVFDRRMDNIFEIQSEIAAEIRNGLSLKFSKDHSHTIQSTENIQAYNAYLKGLERLRNNDIENIKYSIRYFIEAIELDKNFSQAYSKLALAYSNGIVFDLVSKTYSDTVFALSNKAIQINPNDSYIWSDLGTIYHSLGNHEKALQSWEMACDLNPNNYLPYINLGFEYWVMGRLDDAYVSTKRAQTLNPFSENIVNFLSLIYEDLGLDSLALTYRKKFFEMDRSKSWNYYYLRIAHFMAMKQYSDADNTIDEYLTSDTTAFSAVMALDMASRYNSTKSDSLIRLVELRGKPKSLEFMYNTNLAYTLINKGQIDSAKTVLGVNIQLLESLYKLGDHSGLLKYHLIQNYAMNNDFTKMLEWMEVCLEEGSISDFFLSRQQIFQQYQDRPEFKDIENRNQEKKGKMLLAVYDYDKLEFKY